MPWGSDDVMNQSSDCYPETAFGDERLVGTRSTNSGCCQQRLDAR